MAEPRFLIVAPSVDIADNLLGVLPADACADLALLGADAVDRPVTTLPVARIVCVPRAMPDIEPARVGALIRDLVTAADIVVLDSSQASRDLTGWLSATLDLPVVWAVDAIRSTAELVEADRVVLGGSHRLVHRLPDAATTLVMAKPTLSATGQGRTSQTMPDVTVHEGSLSPARVRVLEAADASAIGVPLAAARVVVSVGRGIGGADNVAVFRELADSVGAALGASRVAVDSGWVPFAHQVGQTGTAVAPDVYVAFGISGAIQHMAGMRASKRIVAINTDVDAPLCRTADVVIQADAVEVATALLRRLAPATV